MSKYDVVVTLFTIVYGIMLTDLFLSFHKLIRYRKIVKWHWLPLLAAWYLFLIILKNWWELAFFQESSDWMNIFYFIAYGHLLVLIFLLVSTALPDDIQKNGVELKAYYFENHRYFWGLMSTVVLVSLSIDIIKRFHSDCIITPTTPTTAFKLGGSASQSIGVLIILFLKEQRQRTVWLVGKFFFGSLPVCFKASVLVVFSLTLKLS